MTSVTSECPLNRSELSGEIRGTAICVACYCKNASGRSCSRGLKVLRVNFLRTDVAHHKG
jgi:hypothetical protein